MIALKRLSTTVLLTLFLFSSSLLAADFRIWDPKDGLPVRQGHHIEWFRSIDTDANGNICVVWSDTRLSDRDIWAQLISSDGTPQWGEDGKLIVSEYSRQEDPHVFADGDGNWIISWIDYRYDLEYHGDGDVYIQKVDSNGDPLWATSSGVKLCEAIGSQMWVQSFSDNNGGAVAIWIDSRDGQADIYAQHVDTNGNVLWENNGMKVAGGIGDQGSIESSNYTADTDNAGGILFAWTDDRNPTDYNIYGNRVTVDGTLVWAGISGMEICTFATKQSSVRLCPDGNGGCFLVWQDNRNFDSTNIDLYGQHIDGDGTVDWEENGVPICNHAAIQQQPRIVTSGTNEAIVIWEDKRVDLETEDLYSQKISDNNSSLELHWGTTGQELSGNLVCDANAGQTQARLTPDMNGGVYMSWVDERWGTAPDNELFGQHLDADGNRDWGDPNGIIISDQALSQNGNIIRAFNSSSAGFVWADYRYGSPALYFQIYDIDGDDLLAEDGELLIYGMDNNGEFPTVIPSTGNTKLIIWEDGRFGSDLGKYPYMQRINGQTGEILDEGGHIPLTPGFPFGETDTVVVEIGNLSSISDGNGGAFSVWIDNRYSEDPHLFMQKTDANGINQWGDRGTPVGYTDSDIYEQDHPFIVSTDDGGVVVIYNQLDDEGYHNLRAQRLNANAESQWSSDDGSGYQLNTGVTDHVILAVEKFNDGSVLVIYKDDGDQDLYAQRILLTGENAWEEPVAISTADYLQDRAKTVKLNNDILVVWEDGRRGGSTLDIYGQIISPDGSLSLTTDGLLLVEQDNQQVAMALLHSGNYSWMAWQDSRDGQNDDIYIQKYDLTCNSQLSPESGIMLGLDSQRKLDPKVLSDGDDGIYVIWVEESGENHLSDIRYTHLDSDGNFISADYPTEGLPLSVAFHNQKRPVIVSDGESGFFSVWQDDRSTGKEFISNIYMQRVNDWFVSVNNTPDTMPEGWSLANAYPNPFNPSTRIAFNVGKAANVTLTVYDILGREVVKLVDGRRDAGNHIINWNGTNATGSGVASGTYFYRLEADDVMITKKMILMK